MTWAAVKVLPDRFATAATDGYVYCFEQTEGVVEGWIVDSGARSLLIAFDELASSKHAGGGGGTEGESS